MSHKIFNREQLSDLIALVTNISESVHKDIVGALDFKRGEYVELNNPPQLQITRHLSVEAWFKTSGFKDIETLGTYYDYHHSLVGKWHTGNRGSASKASYKLGWDGSGMFFAIQGSEEFLITYAEGKYFDNKWHHVAGTWDGKTLRIFIDGEEKHSKQSDSLGLIKRTKLNVRIGFDASDMQDRHFQGSVAEVRIWDRTRTQEEIKVNKHHRLTGNEAGLVGYWPFDEDAGNIVHDLTKYANHGTVEGVKGKPNWVSFD